MNAKQEIIDHFSNVISKPICFDNTLEVDIEVFREHLRDCRINEILLY